MYCIYHNADLDGFSSAAIVKRKYPHAIFIGYDYGKPTTEIDAIPDGEEIVMVDVSLPMADMWKLAERSKFQMTWIDHHVSAINDYNAMVKDQRDIAYPDFVEQGFLRGIRVVGKAACELAWEYFYPDSKRPWGISMLGNYDVWRNEDKDLWNDIIMPFQMGMKQVCNSAETFPMVIFGKREDDGPSWEAQEFTERTLDNGKIILSYQKQMNITACKNVFEATIKGFPYRAICLNNTMASSTVFDSVYDETKHDLMCSFYWTGKFWRTSFYTTKKDVNCSLIAKANGGGGHAQAAGCQLDNVFDLLKQ